MKKKMKGVLFATLLAVVGLFGISSTLIDKQVNETPVVEKADAWNDYTTSDYIWLDVSADLGSGDHWNKDNASFKIRCANGDNQYEQYGAVCSSPEYGYVYKVYFPNYGSTMHIEVKRCSSNGSSIYNSIDLATGSKWGTPGTYIKVTGWNSGSVYDTATATIKEVKSTATGTVLATKTFAIASGQTTSTSTFTSSLSSYTGFSFDNYYTTASGNTKQTSVNTDTTFFARFKPNTYMITYKDKGGSDFSGTHAAGYLTGYTYGVGATLKGATKSGYEFLGWFDNISCTGSAITSISTSTTGNKTFYALWEAVAATYTVTFAIADGQTGWGSFTGGTSITGVPEGSSISTSGSSITINGTTITATPASSTAQYSYAFSSWSNNTGTITADRTITASFTQSVRSYTVSFSKNGVTTTSFPTSQTVQYNGKVTTPSTPAANGYNFGGWYKEAGCVNAWNFSTDVITGARTLYAKWNEYTDFWISFDNGATKTQLTKVSETTGDELYQLSTANTLTVQGGESVTFWRGATAGTAKAFTYESNGLTADTTGDSNNIVTTDNTWKVRNYATGINVYLKIFSDSGAYKFYLGGKEGTISTATYGVYSGSTFYVQDLLKKNGSAANLGSDDCKVAVYFYDPVDESTSVHAWSTSFGTLESSSGGIDLYTVTVPTYNGLTMQWGGAIALRFASDMAVSDLEAHGFDWCIKDSGDSNKKNGVNPGHFATNLQNGIQATYWWGESLSGGYNINGNYFMYSDGGLASGTGIYVDPTNAWGNWDMTVEGYHIYARFYGIVGGDGDAELWSSAFTKVPGSTNLWELEVPKHNSASVEWSSIILVYNTSAAWPADHDDQTQYFLFSSTNKNNHHFTFTGDKHEPEWYSEATADNLYNDSSRANDWGKNFVSASGVTCDGGKTPPSTSRWNTAKNDFDAMSSTAKAVVTNAIGSETGSYCEQAVARYDYIIRRYGKTTYSDFAGRIAAGKLVAANNNLKPFNLIGEDSTDTSVIIIIVSASVSLLSITALSVLLVKKRKNKEQ